MKHLSIKILIAYTFLLGSILGNSTNEEGLNMSKVKNIIIFIGDGMGMAQIAASSYKLFGTSDRLTMEKFPVTGFVQTHAADKLITDSASGATAFATGYKTNVGMVGVTPDSVSKKTVFEAAMEQGLKAGIVATSHITDATPSSFVAHVPQRSMQDLIAEQMIQSDLSVILGGGRSKFIPKSEDYSERDDGKNLILEAIEKGFNYVESKELLKKSNSERLMGLFSNNGFEFTDEEPTLADMTKKAIEVLNKENSPFVLMVEGS